jgi:hypothetical protein
MVLDAKALAWAAQNDIDTAKLKKARIPIYGKWYFPEIPANVPLVNLQTGEQQIFPERVVAGEVIYVPAANLQEAGLAPSDFKVMSTPEDLSIKPPPTQAPLAVAPEEPLVAMARPVGLPRDGEIIQFEEEHLVPEDPSVLAGIHMPTPSIAPFVLAIGFFLALLGLVLNPIIVIVGLLWMLAGAVAWIRVGVLEARAAAGHDSPGPASVQTPVVEQS